MIASVACAMALTLPYPGSATTLALAVYTTQRSAQAPADAVRVMLSFEGVDAHAVVIEFSSNEAIGPVLILSNALASCTPYAGTLDALRSRPFPAANAPHAVTVDGQSLGPATAFSANVTTSVSRQQCTLNRPARRTDFSTYALDILSGYRFFEDPSNAQFDIGDERLRPSRRYLVNLASLIDEARFVGGSVVDGRPTSRRLTSDDSATAATWKDTHLAQSREFALFIFAGTFALGISMLVELLKPQGLEPG